LSKPAAIPTGLGNRMPQTVEPSAAQKQLTQRIAAITA
jgi:hypothetical protein